MLTKCQCSRILGKVDKSIEAMPHVGSEGCLHLQSSALAGPMLQNCLQWVADSDLNLK